MNCSICNEDLYDIEKSGKIIVMTCCDKPFHQRCVDNLEKCQNCKKNIVEEKYVLNILHYKIDICYVIIHFFVFAFIAFITFALIMIMTNFVQTYILHNKFFIKKEYPYDKALIMLQAFEDHVILLLIISIIIGISLAIFTIVDKNKMIILFNFLSFLMLLTLYQIRKYLLTCDLFDLINYVKGEREIIEENRNYVQLHTEAISFILCVFMFLSLIFKITTNCGACITNLFYDKVKNYKIIN
jgi:hypothetical protein